MSTQGVARTRIDSRRRWLPPGREFWRYRQLVTLLGRRDMTVRYRQTVLGALWIFTGPIISAGLFTFVFGRVAQLPSGGVPYFVFAYAGLIGWNLFSSTLTGTSGSLTANQALITKIYFPRMIVPFSSFASTLVNLVISLGLMLVFLLVSGVGVSLQILLLPVWLLLATALAMGLGLAFTALSVWYRDINYLTPVLIQILLFLSPVAYSLQAVPADLRNVYLLNPMAVIIEGTRWSLLGSDYLPPAWSIALCVVVTAAATLFGVMVFSRAEGKFADAV